MDDRLVNYFFSRLKQVYGANYKFKFSTKAEETAAKGEWADQIVKLEKAQLDMGFKRLRELKVEDPDRWRWPDIGATLKLCQPKAEDLGMTPVDLAWHEAEQHCHHPLEHDWSHRAVFLAGHYTGWMPIRIEEHPKKRKELREVFTLEYQKLVMLKYMTGHIEPQKALEDHGEKLTELEKSSLYHEMQLKDTMRQQNINPTEGRQGALNRLKTMGFLKTKEQV